MVENQPHISLEDTLIKLQNAKSFKIYEYYDGYYVTIDKIKYLIYADENIDDDFYYLSLKVLPEIFKALPNTNIEKFYCTSRFASETNHKYFKGLPTSLKKLKLDNLVGLNLDLYQDQLKKVSDIIFSEEPDYYEDDEYAVNPVKLLNKYNIVSRFAYD